MAVDRKIIINELLTFIQNKIDILDELSILQICASNFSDADIESGKDMLFSSITDAPRCVSRKGEDKNKKNLKDMIKLLKETDPEKQPLFVAKELNRLPPVTFDHVDVTRLLKDITLLKNELQSLRMESVSRTEIMKLHDEIKLFSCNCKKSDTANISSTKRMRHKSMNSQVNNTYTPLPPAATTQLRAVPAPAPQPPPPPSLSEHPRSDKVECSEPVLIQSSGSTHMPTYRDIVSTRAQLNSTIIDLNGTNFTDENGFTRVVRKKQNVRKNKRGTLECCERLQVVEPTCSIYISRIKKHIKECDILEHIKERGEECLSVELLKQYNETSFNSFKVTIPSSKAGKFLDNNFWPVGLVYRRYKERIPRADFKQTIYGSHR